jgi:hypothetical protein
MKTDTSLSLRGILIPKLNTYLADGSNADVVEILREEIQTKNTLERLKEISRAQRNHLKSFFGKDSR